MRAAKWITVLCMVVVVLAVVTMSACTGEDPKYFGNVSAYSFWDNTGAESIAQYKYYDIMDKFLSEGTIQDGKSVKDGKVRRVLFLGWDGTRADAMTNIFFDENNFGTNSYNYPATEYSGLNTLKKQGGIYLAYAGGEKGTDTEQETSTCAGWTSELTGAWHTTHGVNHNDDVKNMTKDTIMLHYAKLGLHTSLAFEWGQYFDVTLRNEISYLLENPDTPMLLRDTDRTKANSNADIVANENLEEESDILAVDLDHYNFVAMDQPLHEYKKYDVAMRDYILERIASEDSWIGGLFHSPDTNGHTTGFSNEDPHYVNSVRNADAYLYTILQEIERREAECNEEWLVLVTADHGGSGRGHGLQIYEHRTIWVASNRPIDASYYGKNYDGYKENVA